MSTATTTSVEVDYYALLPVLTGRLRSDLDEPPTEQESFSNDFQQEHNASQMYRDIRQLRQAVNDINSVFQKVRNDLEGFDQSGFPAQDGHPMVTYHWTQVRHNLFRQTMEQSYNNAVVASEFMSRHCRLLPDSGNNINVDTVPNLVIELEWFLQELKAKEDVAYGAQKSFKTLAEHVRFYAAVFADHLQSASGQVAAELTNTRAHLADLQRRLNVTHAKIEEWESDRDAATAAMGAASVSLFFIPFVGVAMTGGAIHARNLALERLDNSRRQASSLEREINECMHRLGPLQDKERLLNHYQQLRNTTEVDIAALANKIEIISNIWQCLKADMQKVHEQLRLALIFKILPRRFMVRLRNVCKIYSNLAVLFEEYANHSEPGTHIVMFGIEREKLNNKTNASPPSTESTAPGSFRMALRGSCAAHAGLERTKCSPLVRQGYEQRLEDAELEFKIVRCQGLYEHASRREDEENEFATDPLSRGDGDGRKADEKNTRLRV
ncbi:uncharacterized protein TRAVEDRAFT_24789 [Trametes versicolor FP-101664 SS1]|uniref:Uncharacterized protein n=1 Tax=Trametes versicolor (strain FP-101664) TaxID=717944 RepID=R7S7Y9_TRAVS|nr:uncharacterized protein TRAVEDRAFT_24789 [Trametes versicolor FP-101664 SS1]EIW52116.1 hypothetical protein TRAVEDRAFT_24789 [Trametes versicolor FP-101664 SS1]